MESHSEKRFQFNAKVIYATYIPIGDLTPYKVLAHWKAKTANIIAYVVAQETAPTTGEEHIHALLFLDQPFRSSKRADFLVEGFGVNLTKVTPGRASRRKLIRYLNKGDGIIISHGLEQLEEISEEGFCRKWADRQAFENYDF